MKVSEKSLTQPITMTLYSGREVDIFNLKPEDINIEDIAHSLSNLCRFGGHCLFNYSVAQHSFLCSLEPGTKKEKFSFLLHDASEAYVNDLVRPIKHRPELKKYRDLEDDVQRIIFEKFGLDYPFSEKIHQVDNKVLIKEIKELIIMKHEVLDFSKKNNLNYIESHKKLKEIKLKNCTFEKISTDDAKKLFVDRFFELKNSIKL